MATIGGTPMPDVAAGAAALDRHLENILQGKDLDRLGWSRPDKLTLLVPLFAQRASSADLYLVRLGFHSYPEWPPSTQFVNPESLRYDMDTDKKWLPKIEGAIEIAVHPEYDHDGKKIQLICCSYTLEFYEVKHGVDAQHLWDAKTHTFAATLAAIRRGLLPEFYKGPFEPRS